MSYSAPFKLILLNMPIGHLGDVTARVKEVLSSNGPFAVEDTRSFIETLKRLGINYHDKKIISYHDQSDPGVIEQLLGLAKSSGVLYYASEAGSPALSDPALPLVKAFLEAHGEVDSFSGISSVTQAIELSGLPAIPFTFHGFLPRTENKIREEFKALNQGTHVYFESPHRIESSLGLLSQIHPQVDLVVCKELTKTYQKVWRGKAVDAMPALKGLETKGEFVFLFYLDQSHETSRPYQAEFERWLTQGQGEKELSKILSGIVGMSSKEIYQMLVQNKRSR